MQLFKLPGENLQVLLAVSPCQCHPWVQASSGLKFPLRKKKMQKFFHPEVSTVTCSGFIERGFVAGNQLFLRSNIILPVGPQPISTEINVRLKP